MSHDNLLPGQRIQLRRDTESNWSIDNPVLRVGETGWTTDTRRVKLGDGVTAWNDLPYAADEAAAVAVEEAARIAADAVLQTQIDAIEASDVDSVNGQTGAVTLDAADIPFAPASGITATDVQGAVVEAKSDAEASAATALASEAGIRSAADADLDTRLDAVEAIVPSDVVMDGDPAGGVLSGTFPNPGFAVDMATQAELDGETSARAAADSGLQSDIDTHVADTSNPHAVTKTQVGLGNADNTSDAAKPVSTATQTALDAKLDNSQKGAANGLAELDETGRVPSAQLPSYVDDVVVVANFAALPGTGESSKIYVTEDTNLTYRWSGSAYVEISASLALGETSATAYRGDRGKVAYDHSQDVTTNPHNVTKAQVGLGNVDNTSDVAKPVSTATQTALDAKTDETITVTGATSLTGGGDLTVNRTLTLVNDSATPGASRYYGTDSGGVKGFFAIPAGDPTVGGDLTGTASNAQIVANAVGATELAADAVTNVKVAAGAAIAQSKIANLTTDLAAKGKPVATDGSFSLPAPSGSGLEFVITANVLEDIRMNGASL